MLESLVAFKGAVNSASTPASSMAPIAVSLLSISSSTLMLFPRTLARFPLPHSGIAASSSTAFRTARRMAPRQQQRVIRFLDSVAEHAAEHPTPVDEERHVLARAFVTGGETGIAGDDGPFGVLVLLGAIKTADRNNLLGNLQTIDFDQHT